MSREYTVRLIDLFEMIRIVCDFPFTVYGKNVTRLIIRGVSPGSIAKEGPNFCTLLKPVPSTALHPSTPVVKRQHITCVIFMPLHGRFMWLLGVNY